MGGYEVIGAEEQNAVNKIFLEGNGVLFRHGFDALRGSSYQVRDFENEFKEYLGTKHALAVSSGTAALRVALASLGIGFGDEVITQSFTFVATVEAIVESGATPVCTEIDRTLNMCPTDLISRINEKTRAVIVVHMLGTPANLGEIQAICKSRGIPLIEDTAWGCGGNYKNKKLGTVGDIGCYSFDFAKTITTGEGGMVVFNEESYFLRAKAYHDHGHDNNPNLPRWEDTRSTSGFNYRMSEMQGAVGRAQLKKLDFIVQNQRKNALAISTLISEYTDWQIREEPTSSEGTSDAVVFFTNSASHPLKVRKQLLLNNISTKILPEATTWHFARDWGHIFSRDNFTGAKINQAFPKSHELLSKCVAIPNFVFLRDKFLDDLEKTLKSGFWNHD